MKSATFLRLAMYLFGAFFVASAQSQTATEKTYQWTYIHWSAFAASPFAVPYMEQIEKQSGGRIRIRKLEAGQHPYTSGDAMSAVKNKLADVQWNMGVTVAGVEPVMSLLDLPFLFSSVEEFYDFMEDPANKNIRHTIFEGPLDRNNQIPLLYYGYPDYMIAANVPVNSLDALKGKRIRTFNPELAGMIKILGGVGTNVAYAEVYTALQRNLLDGFVTVLGASYRTKFFEVAKHITLTEHNTGLSWFSINKNSFAQLPENLRTVVLKVSTENEAYIRKFLLDDMGRGAINAAIVNGATITAMSPELREQARAAMKPVWASWASRVGPQGSDLIKRVDTYHSEWMKKKPRS